MTQKTKLVPVTREPALLPERDADKSPVLECIDLGITFGGLKAVDSFNITIGRTEIAGLIGPNGAGKTTIFNLLTKVYQPTHGTILLNGKDIQGLNTAQINRAGIARTFQNIRLWKSMTVFENVLVAKHMRAKQNVFSAIFRANAKEEARMQEETMELLKEQGLDIEELAAAAYEIGRPLPWQHLDMGFTEAYLISEWQKAQREEFTPMCFDLCRRCGVCGEAQV